MSFELARKVADAVLYEGYVLYPYRASAAKNRVRWQFGVVVPRGYAEREGSETWSMQTECLVEPAPGVRLDARLRFLQVQARTIEERVTDAAGEPAFRPVEELRMGDASFLSWDEGVEREIDVSAIDLESLASSERVFPVDLPSGRDIEPLVGSDGAVAARIVRERWPIAARIRISAEAAGDLLRVRIRIENQSAWGDDEPLERNAALRRSLIAAHTLLVVKDGAFVSLLDPPPSAAEAAAACRNENAWPVLIGPEGRRDIVLSSPIILYDYPAVAPESPGDLCDAAEIDEILTLRIMTMTEEEKREAGATDERARRIVERSDSISPEVFEKMHGALRAVRPAATPAPELGEWESFLNPEGTLPPADDSLEVGGVRVAKGDRVRIQPKRRADSIDLFLAGRAARVEGIFRDVDGGSYVAVVLDDEASGELHGWSGRFFYFYPEEIEPLSPVAAGTDAGRG